MPNPHTELHGLKCFLHLTRSLLLESIRVCFMASHISMLPELYGLALLPSRRPKEKLVIRSRGVQDSRLGSMHQILRTMWRKCNSSFSKVCPSTISRSSDAMEPLITTTSPPLFHQYRSKVRMECQLPRPRLVRLASSDS